MRAWLTFGTAILLVPALTTAQPSGRDDPGQAAAPPLTLTYVDGSVDIARDTGVSRADVPDLLDEGDRLLSTSGRAELVFADGAVAHVDSDTELRVDGDTRLRLVRGHVIVRTSVAGDLVLATPAGLARLAARGEYDVTASDLDGDTAISTIRGHAELRTASGDWPIAPEEVLSVDPRNPQPRWARAYAVRSPLSAWADDRMNESGAALRGQPLPPALAPYAQDFAAHGQWTSVAPYGQVWMPVVVAGWRPYMNGSWRSTRHGWTWIDSDPWAWPVHHYGRWGRHASGRWFWIPRAAWGPAWVSWAIGPDHVGWSPLGWDSRPVVDFFAGARLGPIDVWASTWSVVPRQSFGRGPIVQHLQDLRYLPGPVLGGFVVQSRPPLGGDGWRTDSRRWSDRGDTPPGPSRVPGTGAASGRRMPPGTAPPPSGWARPRDARDDDGPAGGGSVAPLPAQSRRPEAQTPPSPDAPGTPHAVPTSRVPRREPDAPSAPVWRSRPDGAAARSAPPPAAPAPAPVPAAGGGSGGDSGPGWSNRPGQSRGAPPATAGGGEARPRGDAAGHGDGGGRGGGATGPRGGEGGHGTGRAAPPSGGGGGVSRRPR